MYFFGLLFVPPPCCILDLQFKIASGLSKLLASPYHRHLSPNSRPVILNSTNGFG
jgi:hypothetical protein